MIIEALDYIARRVARLPGLRVLKPLLRTPYHRLRDRAARARGGFTWRIAGSDDRWKFDADFMSFPFETIEPEVYAFLAQMTRPGMVVYDIGAFIGYHALNCAKRVGDAGRVYAFEPHPKNRYYLARHLEWNGLEDRVTVIPRAVTDKHGGLITLIEHTDPSMHAVASSGSELPVPQCSIDGLVQEATIRTPDLLKIDVEGAEEAVLRGARETLRTRPPILMAIHPEMMRQRYGRSLADLKQVIDELGYLTTDLSGEACALPIANDEIVLR